MPHILDQILEFITKQGGTGVTVDDIQQFHQSPSTKNAKNWARQKLQTLVSEGWVRVEKDSTDQRLKRYWSQSV